MEHIYLESQRFTRAKFSFEQRITTVLCIIEACCSCL